MKRFPKWLILLNMLLIFLILLPGLGFAQSHAGDPGCDPSCNCRADGTYCPIDGGLYALLAIGIGYGILRYKQSTTSPTSGGNSGN
jgi:hypothetical protein